MIFAFHEYQISDHLGNLAVTFKEENDAITVLQRHFYYPFGMNFDGVMPLNTSTENRFQYNGKELEKDFGIDLSDYGARWYDAAIGRFTSVDPLASDYSFQSPYAYATNNPVLLRDILGMGVENEYVRDDETGELVQVGDKGGDETDYIYSGHIRKDADGNITQVAYTTELTEVLSVGMMFSPDLAIGSEWSTERVPGAIVQHTSGSDAIQPVDDPFTMMAPGAIKYLGTKLLAYSAGKIAANESSSALFSLTRHGQLTDGVYTVSKEAMKKHVFGGVSGRSIFYPTLNAEEAVLKAARYADEAGLWIGNKAKVPVLNTNIGTLGNGTPTNVINVYRNLKGFIHGSPGTIR